MMKKARVEITSFCLAVGFFVLSNACETFAGDTYNCAYNTKSEKNKKVHMTFFGEGDFVKLRFLGPAPDLYFAHTNSKGEVREFVEFAKKDSFYKSIKLIENKTSKILVEHLIGGNIYKWVIDNKEHELSCKPDKRD